MYKVYIFALESVEPGKISRLFTGLAITNKAKWVAGSCSQTAENALAYLERMKVKIAERVGRSVGEVELVREWRPDLVAKAFETMP